MTKIWSLSVRALAPRFGGLRRAKKYFMLVRAHIELRLRVLIGIGFASIVFLSTSGSAQAFGFSDPGFTRGAIRTEYDQGVGAGSSWLTLSYTSGGAEGCLWNASDPIADNWKCPGRAPFPGSYLPQPWLGLIQSRDACGNLSASRIGDSWISCISYYQSNQFQVNWAQNTDYWVVVANSDPSMDQCNLGPPNLSWPVLDPINVGGLGYFKVASEAVPGTSRQRAHMIINANDFTHKCQNNPSLDWHYTIPFLSIGAQQARGQSDPIAYINNPPYLYAGETITFDATMYAYEALGCRAGSSSICNTATGGGKPGSHAGLYLLAEWGGKKRLIFIDYFGAGSLSFGSAVPTLHWNWPIAESFFYPGAEIVFFNASTLQSSCGITIPSLPENADPSTRVTTHYTLNASSVFSCASNLGKFDTAMPAYSALPLIGVHWYVESVGTQGALWIAVENMNAI